jgi:hypothetical protein
LSSPKLDRDRAIAQALPEVERELQEPKPPLRSLRGLWKDLGFDIGPEEIDEARREATALNLGVPFITRDRSIKLPNVTAIW